MATTALSSLRVFADMDASGYDRGSKVKIAADQAMIASDKARGAALGMADAAAEESSRSIVRLSRAYIDGYASGSKFEQEIRSIGRAMDAGMGLDRTALLLENVYRKFGLTANAAQLAGDGFVRLAPLVEQLNARYNALGIANDNFSRGFGQAAHSLNGVTQNARLTSFGLQNLGFQLNDIAVMTASGQAPFTMLMQQGMQIGQIFGQEGINTAGGAIKAFGAGVVSFVTNPINLGVIAIAALAGGAVSLFHTFSNQAKSTDDILKRQKDALNELSTAYGSAATKASEFYLQQTQLATRGNAMQALDDLRRDMLKSGRGIVGGGEFGSLAGGVLSQEEAIAGEAQRVMQMTPAIEALRSQLSSGQPNFLAFQRWMAVIENTSADDAVRQIANALRSAVEPAADLQRRTEQLAWTLGRLKEIGAFSAAEGSFRGAQFVDPQITGQMEKQNLLRQRALVTERELGEIEIRALSARSPLEQASIAAARARVDALRDGIITEQESLRITQAGALARAQAEHEIQQAAIERQRGMLDAQSSAQVDLMTIGKTVDAATAMRTQFQLATAAKNALYAATGSDIIPQDELDRIQRYADAMGEIAKQAAEARLQSDALFERDQLSRNSMDRTIAGQLHGAGLPLDDQVGAQLRYNEELKRATGYMDQWRDASAQILDDLLQGKDAMQDIGRLLLQMGEKQLITGLFGEQGQNGGGLFGGWMQRLLNPNAPATQTTTAQPASQIPGFGASTPSSWVTNAIISRPLAPLGTHPAILDLISRAEGTANAPGGGYNTSLGFGHYLPGGQEQNLTGMSLDQIRSLQAGMLANPDNPFNSSAIGRYQFTSGTLMDLRKEMGLSGSEMFDPAMQDRLAMQLIANRGATPSTWAGLSHVDPAEIQKALADSSQKISTSLSDVATTVGQSGTQFASQFPAGLDAILRSMNFSGGPSLDAITAVTGGSGGLYAPVQSRGGGRAGNNVSVRVVNQHSGAEVEARPTQRPDGGIDLDVMVRRLDRHMANKYGLRQPTIGH